MSNAADVERAPSTRRHSSLPLVAGIIGTASVAVGYLLEAVRQRGTCDLGDASPDTLALSVILIVCVGGIAGLTGILASAVLARRSRPRARAMTTGLVLSAISLMGATSIFLVAGSGPSTWFQYCAT